MKEFENLSLDVHMGLTVEVVAKPTDVEEVNQIISDMFDADEFRTLVTNLSIKDLEGGSITEFVQRTMRGLREDVIPVVIIKPGIPEQALSELVSAFRTEKENYSHSARGPILITETELRYRSDEIGRITRIIYNRENQ